MASTATTLQLITPAHLPQRPHPQRHPTPDHTQYRPSGSASCATLTACGQGAYETTPPTTSTDRQCAPWTAACPYGSFEDIAPSRFQNRECRGCCTGQYRFLQATAKTDTICNAVTVCASNQWQVTAPTATSDRGCVDHTVCTSDENQVLAPSATRTASAWVILPRARSGSRSTGAIRLYL